LASVQNQILIRASTTTLAPGLVLGNTSERNLDQNPSDLSIDLADRQGDARCLQAKACGNVRRYDGFAGIPDHRRSFRAVGNQVRIGIMVVFCRPIRMGSTISRIVVFIELCRNRVFFAGNPLVKDSATLCRLKLENAVIESRI